MLSGRALHARLRDLDGPPEPTPGRAPDGGGLRAAVVAWLDHLSPSLAPGRRAAAYDRELPALLEALASHLRAGGSLGQAITAVAPLPRSRSGLPEHWDRVVALAPARGIDAALADWASAPDATGSVALAAGALRLAAATGGSAARAIDGVASTLRSRLAVADEIRALSSQARASAAVIALAPVAFGAFAGATDRRIAEFFTTSAGAVVLVVGLSLDAVGAWWMSRLCRLRP